MTNTNRIHPKALESARKRVKGGRGLTQVELAEAIGCSKDTVSRWERGKSRRVRARLRDRLCKTLKVEWEELTKPPELKDAQSDVFRHLSEHLHLSERLQRWVSPHVPTALFLVAKRYGIKERDVLDIAPLLFLIVAERSLLERRRRLEEMREILNDADQKFWEMGAHLREVAHVTTSPAAEMFELEQKSLEERDVFGHVVDEVGGFSTEEGPFLRFVQCLAEGLPKDAVTDIESADNEMIFNYQVAEDTLRDLTGVTEDGAEGSRTLRWIRCGRISLSECVKERNSRDENGYRQWLAQALSKADEENERAMEEFERTFGVLVTPADLADKAKTDTASDGDGK